MNDDATSTLDTSAGRDGGGFATTVALRGAAGIALSCLFLGGCGGAAVRTDRAPDLSTAQARASLSGYYRLWEGTPYRIGGSTRRGVDCSAFVQAAYRDLFAIELPRTTKRQAALRHRVKRSQLQSGDLVFFKTGWLDRHVGIYVDGDSFIHASTSKGVTRSSLADGYWARRYWKSVRVAPF